MDELARVLLFCACSLVVACSKAEDPVTPSRAVHDAAVESAAPDTAIVESGPAADTAIAADSSSFDTEVPIDTGAVDMDAGPPPAPVDCLTDDFGPSSVSFLDMFYERLVKECTSSACSDFYKIDASCTFKLQVEDVEHTATLSEEHCAKMKKWLTSDLLVNKLRDTVTCYGSKSGIYESTQLTLSDGPAWKKTYMCPLEPFASHRACLDQLRAIYFPGL